MAAAATEAPSEPAEMAAVGLTLPDGCLHGGEVVLLAVKPSMWRPVFDAAPWAASCCAMAVAITWLNRPMWGLSLSVSVQLLMMVVLARLGIAVVRWVPTWHVLTNRRVIDITGVRAPRVFASSLVEIRNTYLSETSSERLAGLGTITFATERADELPRVWQSIAMPQVVHEKIRKAIRDALDRS